MAYIKVEYSKMKSAYNAVDNYVKVLENDMKKAQGELKALSVNWQGGDFTQFKKQWQKVDDSDSTHTQMVKSLKSYSEFLKYAEKEYKSAQRKAIEAANSLPRW